MPIFTRALDEMTQGNSSFYGPESFQLYLETHGLPTASTASSISVDLIDKLRPELRNSGTMIFRLGSRPGIRGTHFWLAKFESDWSNYFLVDEILLRQTSPEIYLPNVSVRHLFAFQLLPKLTETSLVNLAVGSGLLQRVLGLGSTNDITIPATGQSTFTFQFFPRADLGEPWDHINGQVEIDALIVGRRDNRETLFLIEAKSGRPQGSLAKHKRLVRKIRG